MGLVAVMDLYIENTACRDQGQWWAFELLLFGAVAGLAGSLVRSPSP